MNDRRPQARMVCLSVLLMFWFQGVIAALPLVMDGDTGDNVKISDFTDGEYLY